MTAFERTLLRGLVMTGPASYKPSDFKGKARAALDALKRAGLIERRLGCSGSLVVSATAAGRGVIEDEDKGGSDA